VIFGPDHPANHFNCDSGCPCTCGNREPYEANAGTMCRDCLGMIERKRVHRFEHIAEVGGITILGGRFDEINQ